ncbi:unnamed protein product [Bursaphelenchus okinawaensis]|uniref:Uncharacterized protein n=1 Tax=Bursaphelenchus okinawaensis TaxID=465554 RepID=A0A811JR09_9BILA|nr:unnamed protein product [Bursaphelenchus okinawaensis]CAG9078431.1 unnamed protein product [Bursaphelenchus okinawaensis]
MRVILLFLLMTTITMADEDHKTQTDCDECRKMTLYANTLMKMVGDKKGDPIPTTGGEYKTKLVKCRQNNATDTQITKRCHLHEDVLNAMHDARLHDNIIDWRKMCANTCKLRKIYGH